MIDTIKTLHALLDEKFGENITHYDLSQKHPLVDHVLVATVSNPRKMQGIIDAIRKLTQEQPDMFSLRRVEGKVESGWVLIDLTHTIIHLLTEELRAQLSLEQVLSKTK